MKEDILNPHTVLCFHHTGFNAWKENSHVPSVKFACGHHGTDLRTLCKASGYWIETQTSIPSFFCCLNFMLCLPFQGKKERKMNEKSTQTKLLLKHSMQAASRAAVFIQPSLGEKRSVWEQSKYDPIHQVRLSPKSICKLHCPN